MIWKSINSFDQNNYFTQGLIRKKVIDCLLESKSENLVGVGGEFYGYFVCLKNYKKYFGFTNNLDIYKDSVFNSNLYFKEGKCTTKYLDHYSKIKKLDHHNCDCIVNLSSIPMFIIEFLNKSKLNSIVVISCSIKNSKKLSKLSYKLTEVNYIGRVFIYLYKKK